MISNPISVDPVKATLSTKRCYARAYPAVGPYPVRIFTTPAGKPASIMSSPILKAVNGVCSAGFITTVHPVARAGPNFQAIIKAGKFQGII